jgi:hypothetical protein
MRNAMLRAGLLAVACLLAGCQSAEQIRAADEHACAGFGFQRGTDGFAGCLQRESLHRRRTLEAAPTTPPYWYPYGPTAYRW